MTSDVLQQLPADTLALLRRHNLHRKLLRGVIVEDAVVHVSLSAEEQEGALQQFCQQNGIESAEALHDKLQSLNLAEADLRWQLELPLRVRRHSEAEFRHKAEARFLERKESLDQVVYSLLRTKDAGLAREFYLQIAGGEASFSDLAANYAEGPERSTRGIVGPVPLTQAHPALAERLRTTAPGELMEPFSIAEWWLVTRLERFEPARFTDAMAQQMAQELFQEWVQQQVAFKLGHLPPASGTTTSA